jgi:aminoglycoside phosphotransferase (APT) family kinase protein
VAPPWAWEIQAALAVTPVSRTWRVKVGDRLAVLRVDEPGARRLGLNRAGEPAVLQAASAAGLGPACIQADPRLGIQLTEWLPGQAWTAADLRQPDNLRRATELLRRVHELPPAGPGVDLGAAIDRYAAAAGSAGASLAARARQCLALALATGRGRTPERLCLCHGDPTPGNFIREPGGGLRLIDWEYAGLCHPGFDLGGLAAGAGLTADEAGLMLATYLGRQPTSADTERQRAWMELCQTLAALWTGAVGIL